MRLGEILCTAGIHSWRDVTRANSPHKKVETCRRGCGARRVDGERNEGN